MSKKAFDEIKKGLKELSKFRPGLLGWHGSKPICFGSKPGPQDQAEYCCNDCQFRSECLK